MKSPKTLNELLHGYANADARPIAAIASDSRAVTAETLWLAARGVTHHALDYYRDGLQAAAIVYEPPYANPPAGAIACEQLGAHLGEIAARFYDHPAKALNVIGVTGTDGKSSLVHFLAQATGGAMLGTIGYGRLDALRATPPPTRCASNNTSPASAMPASKPWRWKSPRTPSRKDGWRRSNTISASLPT